MTNDLKLKSQEFIRLGEKINQGEWSLHYDDNEEEYEIRINDAGCLWENLDEHDYKAILELPNLFIHIAELQKVIDNYEKKENNH